MFTLSSSNLSNRVMFSAKQPRHFCQVAQDRGASCFSFLFALFMLIWLRYTKVQHNNHKTIFKIIFFAKYLYSLLLAFYNKARNSVFLFLFQLLWNASCVALSNWSVVNGPITISTPQKYDTYDTCFYNLFTRAQERRKIYIIYIKKRKQKVSKTGVTGVMCHRNGIYRMWVCD